MPATVQIPLHNYCLGLGSNIHPEINLPCAAALLRHLVQVQVFSNAWETPAVGDDGPNFINASALVIGSYPAEWLQTAVLHRIENHLGRARTANKNAPRTIDLDILIVDGKIIEDQIWTRAHLAIPVAELMPNLTSPLTGQKLVDTARQLASQGFIRIRPDINLSFIP